MLHCVTCQFCSCHHPTNGPANFVAAITSCVVVRMSVVMGLWVMFPCFVRMFACMTFCGVPFCAKSPFFWLHPEASATLQV